MRAKTMRLAKRRLCRRKLFQMFMSVGVLAVLSFELYQTVGWRKAILHLTESENSTVHRIHPIAITKGTSGIEDNTLVKWIRRHVGIVAGQPQKHRVYLTIGVPVISREGHPYYLETLDFLFNGMRSGDTEETIIVVYLADTDKHKNTMHRDILQDMYYRQLESGQLHIVMRVSEFYPTLENITQNYGDSVERVKWRSKQNLDYSVLMSYCSYLSDFYLQLEDDIEAVKGYITEIKTFAKNTTNWTCLEFSRLGFIGKFFHTKDIVKLATVMWTFFDQMPSDYILLVFLQLTVQKKRLFRTPSLFQHLGDHSSLPGINKPYRDKFFAGNKQLKLHRGENPPAVVSTTMIVYADYKLNYAYSSDGYNFFWARAPKVNDSVLITFKNKQNISHVIVETGLPDSESDKLQNAVLEYSEMENEPKFEIIKNFINGSIDAKIDSGSWSTKNLRIRCTAAQTEWLVIREIAVFRKR